MVEGSPMARAWHDALAALLAGNRLAQDDELPAVVDDAVAGLGVVVTIYLVDMEQHALHAVPRPGHDKPPPLDIDSTPAGRAFREVSPVPSPATDGGPARLWMPLLDDNDRLGVLDIVAVDPAVDPHTDDFRAGSDLLSQMIGHLVASKRPYGDTLTRTRRTRRMSEAAELVWRLLPPLTFATRRIAVAAVLEPCYEVGGDGFDYAVDDSTAFFAVFDTAGHDLRSGLGTATVMAAVRAARAEGADLDAIARAADGALVRFLPELRVTTAVLGSLDLETGRLRYVNAGHPPPMVLRDGEVVARLDRGRRLPIGLDNPGVEIAEDVLERGDRILLFTDGVTEAPFRGSDPFGEDRLIDMVRQHAEAGLPTPETLRRLCHAVLAQYDGPPADDATLLFVEWSPEAYRSLIP